MNNITHAYIREHGELPTHEPSLWLEGLGLFTEGWHACLANTEILEIEADVLYQQEGLTRGE